MGRIHGEGNGYSLQYSSLENALDRQALLATVHGVAKSQIPQRLSTYLKWYYLSPEPRANSKYLLKRQKNHFSHKGISRINSLMKSESVSVVSDSLRPHGLQPTGLHSPWNFPGKSTGVGCHFLLQGIFPTQGSNLGLPYCRQTLYHLRHQGSQWNSLLSRVVSFYQYYSTYVINISPLQIKNLQIQCGSVWEIKIKF